MAEAARHEQYAESMSTIRLIGQCAVQNVEIAGVRELGLTDFITGIEENLKTDEEFRPYLDVESLHTFVVRDGSAYTAKGEPVIDVLERGLAASRLAAKKDKRIEAQVVRDSGDLENARAVDGLKPGWARLVPSMDPKEELQTQRKFWESKGYRENILYLQYYCKTHQGTLETGAFSIDYSDTDTWRELFAEYGVEVPENESPNTWIRHAIERELTAEQTRQLALEIRRRYYEKKGVIGQTYSATEYVAKHQEFIEGMFNTYVTALGQAVYSRENNEVMQGLAEAVLAKSDKLSTAVRHQLIRISNLHSFDDEAGRAMQAVLRYAVVEQLRKDLKYLVRGSVIESALAANDMPNQKYIMPPIEHIQNMHHMLAQNVENGTRAGRSYGGCTSLSLAKSNNDSSNSTINSQDVYGGKTKEQDNESGECDYLHTGCYCCPYDSDGKPLGQPLTVKATRDKGGTAHCQRPGCGAWLSADGKKSYQGRIYEKAQKRQTAPRQVGKIAQLSRIEPKAIEKVGVAT